MLTIKTTKSHLIETPIPINEPAKPFQEKLLLRNKTQSDIYNTHTVRK